MTRLIEVTLRVRDVQRSRDFYERLGLPCGPIEADEAEGERHVHATWGAWGPGSSDLLMLNIYPAAAAGAAAPAAIGFSTDDLDGLHARLLGSGVDVIHVPETRPWGRMASYRDPDGNVVSVSEAPR
jgi:catechol 2,3-dioxygenase-like lactoylglutathione lyase family enzyme